MSAQFNEETTERGANRIGRQLSIPWTVREHFRNWAQAGRSAPIVDIQWTLDWSIEARFVAAKFASRASKGAPKRQCASAPHSFIPLIK
jgi:hypothetical protein